MITLIQKIKEHADNQPQNLAVAFKNEQLTYAELNQKIKFIAASLVDLGIKKNDRVLFTICPGIVNTEIYQEFKDNAGDSHDAQMKLERQYLGICQPIDIANAICFLLSDLSRMITGITSVIKNIIVHNL